jgi:hypothetical protein
MNSSQQYYLLFLFIFFLLCFYSRSSVEVPSRTAIQGTQPDFDFSVHCPRHAGGIGGRIHACHEIQQVLQQDHPAVFVFQKPPRTRSKPGSAEIPIPSGHLRHRRA